MVRTGIRVVAVLLALGPLDAAGDAFSAYELVETFSLPAGAGEFDVLSDGRIVTVSGADVYMEMAPGSRTFSHYGTLPDMDVASWGAAFVRVSPDGARLAVGNNGGSQGGYEVGVFDLATLGGTWFAANHWDAEWYDNTRLALTAGDFVNPSVVTLLDTTSPDASDPVNPTVVGNIGGGSGGVAFDSLGNLYTGNGYRYSGPSETGTTKAFDLGSWSAALTGGPPADFEAGGTLIADLLSASSLGFDGQGNLHVGGGDLGTGDGDYAALVRAGAIANALAGGGPADPLDPEQVRRLDPDYATWNFYDITYNDPTGELYVREGEAVFTFAVPEGGSLLLLAAGGLVGLRRRRCVCLTLVMSAALSVGGSASADSPFATEVIDFSPAPGQFVNNVAYNDPARALGPPVGGGTAAPGNSSLVSLGGFGGSITLTFDHTVTDDAANPRGLDAIVFGNATWVGGDPNRRWAECGHLEISRDANANGLPDDPWYLIPGSHILDPAGQFETQTWDDDLADDTYPPISPPASPAWIPPGDSGTWTTQGHRLPPTIFETAAPILENPNGPEATEEGVFGYADHTPTLIRGDLDGDNVVDDAGVSPEAFYTVPDDPFAVGMTPGSGGGDAFDIAWAIDPATGQAASLDGFDFIRITTGVNQVNDLLGEISTELDAVADVAAGLMGDGDWDGDLDLDDLLPFEACMTAPDRPTASPLCRVMDFEGDNDVDLGDFGSWQNAFTES